MFWICQTFKNAFRLIKFWSTWVAATYVDEAEEEEGCLAELSLLSTPDESICLVAVLGIRVSEALLWRGCQTFETGQTNAS